MKIKDKSKKKIVNSLLNLTINNDINEISIDEIITNSGLSRGTFYNHFRNKNDIIIYLEKVMCKSLDDAFYDISPENENYMDIMTHRILPLVYENREYTKILYKYYQPSFFDFIVKRYSVFYKIFWSLWRKGS